MTKDRAKYYQNVGEQHVRADNPIKKQKRTASARKA
jgi:hypothetical protein